METIPRETQAKILELFRKEKTVSEIATLIGYEKKEILLWLTKSGFWSKYCSECVLKRCYDCRGLSELGKPVGIQDQIDLISYLARPKNDPK